MRTARVLGLAALAVALGACKRPGAYQCNAAVAGDCRAADDTAGVCEPTGFCSFPDGTCASGRRYGPYAGGLSGVCVGDEPGPDGGDPDGGGGSCGAGPEAAAISVGRGVVCAIDQGRLARCWGENSDGMLGSGMGAGLSPAPLTVVRAEDGLPLGPVAEVAAGAGHACARLDDGTARCWGQNYRGQLGDPAVATVSTDAGPVREPGGGASPLTGITRIAVGEQHTCAVAQGALYCWGANEYGAVGDGSGADRPLPVMVLDGVLDVALGDRHTCAGKADGTVWCWGGNENGQAGRAPSTLEREPAMVEVSAGVPLAGVTGIAAGGDTSCALVGGGVHCWGDGSSGQLARPTETWSQLAVPALADGGATLDGIEGLELGTSHVCARGADRRLWCWGDKGPGNLGVDVPGTMTATPTEVHADVLDVSAGDGNTCVITGAGQLRCTGDNGRGQLGAWPSLYPSSLTWLDLAGVCPRTCADPAADFLGAGLAHACVVRGGHAWCWGGNGAGGLGAGMWGGRAPVPMPVIAMAGGPPLAGLTSTPQAGGSLGCALAGTDLWCWGDGEGVPQKLLAGVSAFMVGERFLCAQQAAGGGACWGENQRGQFGNGMTSPTPTAIFGAASTPSADLNGYDELVAGRAHACGRSAGLVFCWGAGDRGQLGLGTTDDATTYALVPVPLPAVALAAGDEHTCALLADGSVMCWGANPDGRLGDGTVTDRLGPTAVTGLANAVAIAAGAAHTCAVDVAGAAWCWGKNVSGQLGTGGDRSNQLAPTPVAGVAGATQVVCGESFSCALAAGGVSCWGDNAEAQLGSWPDAPASRNSAAPVGLPCP